MRNTELDVDESEDLPPSYNLLHEERYEYFKIDEEKKIGETFAFFAKRIIIISVVVYAISKYFNAF